MNLTLPLDDSFEPHHASSPTDRVIFELQMYGHRPHKDEPDPRPLPDETTIRSALAGIFEVLAGSLCDTRLEPDLEDLLWSTVNLFHRAADRVQRELDRNEDAQHRSQKEQDGSEVRSVELERFVDANCGDNVRVLNGMLAAGPPQEFLFYMRPDLWMSSTIADQGPYERVLKITSSDVDAFVRRHRINAMVMDIEGAELDLLQNADLSGIERVFLELHDHLYGLAGVRRISEALASNGLIYDPRGSSGPCVLFSRDDGERYFDAEIAHAV